MTNLKSIARVAHEVNRAYCQSIGDTSYPTWEDAPDWQKESVIKGVLFRVENPDSKPSDSHDNWMKEKIADGWVYGEEKDPRIQTHPCIVPYEELPMEQRIKDHLFIGVVDSMVGNPTDFDLNSIGAKRVRFKFNPSELNEVDRAKIGYASRINSLESLREEDGADQRLISEAQTRIEDACMWHVKALTSNL